MNYNVKRLKQWSSEEMFRFPVHLLHFLSEREAILLVTIIDMIRIKDNAGEGKRGWFQISKEQMMKQLQYTYDKKKTQRAIKVLRTKKILKCRVEGGREQWIKVSNITLQNMVDIMREETRGEKW